MAKARTVPYETTIEVRDTCLCLAVQRAARALARRFDDALRPAGLTSGQFSLLMSLNRPEPPTISMVADTLAMDRTTLTAALKPLQREKLVTIAVDKNDRRSRRLMLTAAGHAALNRALPVWKKTHAEIDKLLSHPGGTLRKDLMKLSA